MSFYKIYTFLFVVRLVFQITAAAAQTPKVGDDEMN
jgi:hypothetical protein